MSHNQSLSYLVKGLLGNRSVRHICVEQELCQTSLVVRPGAHTTGVIYTLCNCKFSTLDHHLNSFIGIIHHHCNPVVGPGAHTTGVIDTLCNCKFSILDHHLNYFIEILHHY